jgi:hypothetical protein
LTCRALHWWRLFCDLRLVPCRRRKPGRMPGAVGRNPQDRLAWPRRRDMPCGAVLEEVIGDGSRISRLHQREKVERLLRAQSSLGFQGQRQTGHIEARSRKQSKHACPGTLLRRCLILFRSLTLGKSPNCMAFQECFMRVLADLRKPKSGPPRSRAGGCVSHTCRLGLPETPSQSNTGSAWKP